MSFSPTLFYRATLAAVLAVCLGGVSGCANAGSVPSNGAASVKPDASGFVPTMAKKQGSGVEMAYRIDGAAAPQSPIALTLRFSGVGADGATATMVADEGLTLTGSKQVKLDPQATTEVRISATAATDGVYYVNVTTSQAGRSHVTSVPVTVGNGKAKVEKIGTMKDDATGEKVISLPSK